jgi:hypothetical protein
MWSRLRAGDLAGARSRRDAHAALLQTLLFEAQRVAEARTTQHRAAQLARVLDAVSALAAAHGIDEKQIQAQRRASTKAVAKAQPGVARLGLRAAGAVASKVWVATGRPGARAVSSASVLPAARAWMIGARILARAPLGARRALPGRVGRVAVAIAGSHANGLRLVAASLLHLPRLQRRVAAVALPQPIVPRGNALVLRAGRSLTPEGFNAAALLLWSGGAGLQLSYQVATAGAQLWLRRHVIPRVLRYIAVRSQSVRGAVVGPNVLKR